MPPFDKIKLPVPPEVLYEALSDSPLSCREWVDLIAENRRLRALQRRAALLRPPRDYGALEEWAGRLVTRAVRRGCLPDLQQAPLRCADCEALATGYGHRDYFWPLRVAPLCLGCREKRGNPKPGPKWRLPAGWTRVSCSWFYARDTGPKAARIVLE